MLTNDQVTAAVNAAGFEDQATFTRALSLANLVLQRNALQYAIEGKRAAQQVSARQTEAAVQALTQQIAALDAQLAAAASQ